MLKETHNCNTRWTETIVEIRNKLAWFFQVEKVKNVLSLLKTGFLFRCPFNMQTGATNT